MVFVEKIEADETLPPEKVKRTGRRKAQWAKRDSEGGRLSGPLGILFDEWGFFLWEWRRFLAGRQRRKRDIGNVALCSRRQYRALERNGNDQAAPAPPQQYG